MIFKLISLFSGIGGIDLAFEHAGFEVVCQVENNSYCQQVLQKHWPHVLRLGDIRDVKGTDLPAADVMAGGFPCQDISTAGKGAGIKEGNRSGLWFEFARLIGEFRPAIVFLENVPAITTNGGTTVLNSLAALRYDAEWGIMAAADMGAPHRRERWFCVAYASEFVRRRDNGYEQGRQSAGEGYTVMGDAYGNGWIKEFTGDKDGTTRTSLGYPDRTRLQGTGSGERTRSTNGGTQPTADRAGDVGNATRGSEPYQPARERPVFVKRQPDGSDGQSERERDYAQPLLGRMSDGLSAGMDGHRWPARPGEQQYDWEPPRTVSKGEVPHRADRLKALGNAVVPQVIYPFAVAIREILQTNARAAENEGG